MNFIIELFEICAIIVFAALVLFILIVMYCNSYSEHQAELYFGKGINKRRYR